MQKSKCLIVALLSAVAALAEETLPVSLEAGFRTPPQVARPLVWWDWANGSVTKEGIRADMLDMKRAGIAGVQLFDVLLYMPPGPVRYGTGQWHEHVQYAIKTADELGLEFYTMNAPGWSASGGPWVTPALSMKKLVRSETKASGGTFDKKLPLPAGIKLDFYKDVAVIAVPAAGADYRIDDLDKKTAWTSSPRKRPQTGFSTDDAKAISPDKVLNLTSHMSADGTLTCDLPSGEWTVLRFGYISTAAKNHPAVPEGSGLEIDKFDPAAVEFQFNQALGKMIELSGPYLGKTFKGILFDSFEGGSQNWTAAMPEFFEKQNGYSLIPWLPVFAGRVVGSLAESEAVLYDFRGTVDRLFAENYFGTMQRLAAKHSLIVYSESQGHWLNPFYCNEFVDVPMNEFWVDAYDKRIGAMKQAAASANLYGKNLVGAESFTAKPENSKWQNTPYSLKIPGDCAFASGINRFIFHTYLHQPYSHVVPGFTMGRYGTQFGRLNSWWEYAPDWISYLSRSQFLLQQGRTVTDFCFLLENDIRYSISVDSLLAPAGFDSTMCYAKNLAGMSCRDGLTGTEKGLVKFKIMMLSQSGSFMSLDTLRNLHRLVREGMILVGDAPTSPSGLKDLRSGQEEFKKLTAELWGGLGSSKPSKSVGQGKVFTGLSAKDVAAQMDLAQDVRFPPTCLRSDVRWIHRTTGAEDIYFIANQTDSPKSIAAALRVTGRRPELWDPATGKMWDAKVFNITGAVTEVALQLEPRGSVFVVFRRPLPAKWTTSLDLKNVTAFENLYLGRTNGAVKATCSDGSSREIPVNAAPVSTELTGPWTVKFLDGRGAPDQIRMDKLSSWAENSDPGVKYYSGRAEYTLTADVSADFLKKGRTCLLDLGTVCEIAQVSVNGSQPVVIWKAPFAMDVTGLLKPGKNTFTIRVANLWVNRLIGDEKIPVEYTYQDGGNKFTAGRIESFPDWLADPAKAKTGQKRHTFTTWKHYSIDYPLVPSGLLGPVELRKYSTVTLP